MLLKLKLIV